MSSGGSGTPDGRDPHKDGDDRHAEKGDNYGDGQPELQMSGGSSSNQATTNQQHTLTQKGALSAHVGFTYGKSDQNEAEQGVDSHDRRGGAQGLDVAGTAMASLGGTPTTQGKKTDSLPEFRNIDYSGHFKVNIDSKGTKNTVLKMKIKEEEFVKFCHLFHCDVQLDVVKEAFQSDMKLDVIKGGYPPSVCTQSGASGPLDVTVKSILGNLCYQLSAVNISSTSWDIDHVRAILSSLDSYQRGIVIGYEVSGDEATSWLAGERGSMKSVTETLVQKLGPGSNPVQQSSEYQHKGPDRDMVDSGSGNSLTAQQEQSEHTDRRHQQTGHYVREQEQQQVTDQMTERKHGDQHHKAMGTTNQDHHSEEGHGRPGGGGPDTRPGGCGSDTRPGGSGSDTRPGGSGSDTRPGGRGSDTRPGSSGSDTRPGSSGSDTRSGGCGSDTRPGSSGPDTRLGGSGSDTRPGGSGLDTRPGGSGSDTRPRGIGGAGDGHDDPAQPQKLQQKDRFSDPTQPSIGRQQVGIDGHTGTSMGGQLVGDNDPHGSEVKEAANLEPARSLKEEDGGIPYADDDSEGTSSLTETKKASQQQLAEWSGQNVNSPPQGSMSTPVDQSIDRCQGQGQSGVHRDSVRVQTGGQHAEVQNMSSPTTVDHYKLPQGQPPSTKPDVHHKAETSIITMKVSLGRLEENILYHLPLLEDLRYKFPHVEIDWKKDRHKVAITGDEGNVRRIKTEIEKQLKAVKETKVEIDSKHMKQEALNLFREKSVFDLLTEHISSLKVACYLTKNEDSNGVYLCIYAADTDKERAVRLVTSSVVCIKTELDSTWRLFLESQYVQQELSDLQKEYNGKVSITTHESLVTVYCTTDIENEVLTTVNKMKDDFFSERTKTVEYTPGGDLTVELCTKVLHSDIQMIEEKYCVKCCPVQNKRKQGWKVTGPYGTLEKACNTLKELSKTVTSRHLPLMDKITEDFFRTQPGQDDMARVGENTGCLVTLSEQEVGSSPGTLGQVMSGIQGQVSSTEKSNRSNVAGRQWRSGDGRVVALYCGDGRKSTSDVLVQLTQNKGTQAVRFQHCQERVTITLNLPEWRDGSNKEKDTIHQHFKEIIIMAAEKGYTSLTVLLDDCQQCGWKERKACKLLVKNTLYSLQREPAGACSCAYFIRDQETFMTLRDVIDDSFRDTTQEIPSITDDKDEVALDWEHVHPSDIEEKKAEIVLHKGELAKMASDVIVNTTDTSLKLDYGAVSASILREAGPEIQTECTQYHYRGVKCGEVAITHGYNLKCKHVFHGALPSYGKDRQLKYMISFLWRCLTVADKKRYRTISFPALGTGNLGYPRDLVAKTMFDTVNSYFSEGKDSSIEIVSFVVYPKDTPTVKAFQDEEQKQKVKVLQATSKPTPPVSERTAQLQLRYGPVDLLVTVGQIETATADGLLIFWDNTTLYKSTFSCSYFNESINQDGVNHLRSKRTFMSSKGMTVVTGAGSLHFKSVIHCLIKEDTIDLQTVMSVLAEADNQNLSSVVLSLGTKEPLTRLKAKFVNQFHDALKQFGRRNKTLRRVEIMFDSVDTYKDTEKYIRSQYPDRLEKNQTVTGEEPLGATGGVQTRSMTREANAKQTYDGSSTQTMYRTNLVVAGKLEDTIEKAIQQLKNKISNIKTQHPTVQAPSPATTTSGQDSHPVRPPCSSRNGADAKPEPKVSRRQDDQNSSPVTKSPILETIEYEEKRLVLKSKPPQTLEKESIKAWLKKSGFRNFTVVWPFLQDTEALIIFPSVNDAKKLLKNGDDQYSVDEFPRQTVQNLKATLKTAMVEMIKKCMKPTMIRDEMLRESGAEWLEENGTCFLKGSLPEIQCAYKFIVQLTTGGNVSQGNQQTSNKDRDGADQGGTGGGYVPDSQGNGQDRHAKPDIAISGEDEFRSDTARSQDTDMEGNKRTRQHGNLRLRIQQQNVPKNITEGKSPVGDGADVQDQKHSPEPPYGGTPTNVNKSSKHITTEATKLSSQDGMEDSRQKSPQQLTGENMSYRGQYDDTGNIRPTKREHNEEDKNQHKHETQQIMSDRGLYDDTGNIRPTKGEHNEEDKNQRKHETQQDMFDDMTGTDELFYDNSKEFMHGTDGSAGRRVQPAKNQNFLVKDETVECSAENFSEICFFNEGITDKVVKVEFNEDRTQCCVTDRNGEFKNAKDRLSCYARREINKLTKAEQGKFKLYYKNDMDDRNSMKIFCDYNPRINGIKIVGQNYDMIETTKQRILTAIGRIEESNHGHQVLPPMKESVQIKKRPPPGSEVLHTKQGVRVFVYQGNLLELGVDAIIHGTNRSLDYSGGLAGKIAIAAGPELEKACSNIFHKKGKLNVGDCCAITAGNLHYKFIIHAVIPVWSHYRPHNQQNNQQNRQICQDDLTRSILNSLVEAGNVAARSVALPAVGKGVVPSDMCTAAYKEAVKLFCKNHQYPAMAEIHFVDQDKDILRKVSEMFQTSKPHVTSPAPPAVQNVKRTIVYPFWMAKSVTGGAFRLSDKLSVCFIKQSFMDTQASALVSIEDERFQSQRYVAKEIEKKAGKKYQKEKEKIQKGKKHPKISDVFHTSAGDLRNVLYVLHVIAPVVDSSTSHDKVLWKGITDSIRACFHQVFRKVDELKLDSVALPSFALGTLQDGQTEELWQICVEEVVKYTKHQKSTSQLTRIILADPSAKTISFLMGLLDSMQQPPSVKGTRL